MSRVSSSVTVALVGVGCLVTVSLALSHAQEPPLSQSGSTFRAGINVVQVDVSVLDAQRRPVRGLTAADFAVLEDGKPREIVAFAPVELPARTAATGSAASWTREISSDVATNAVPPEGRLVVIAFDWSIRFEDSQLARRIATETVNDLGPGDEAAVVFTSAFGNAGIPQNFTSNRERLLQAINQPMAFALKGNDVVSTRGGGFINQNGALLEDPNGYTSGDCRCRVCTLDAMTRVADALRAVSGRRKVMIFIGTYFRGAEAAAPVTRAAMGGLPPPPLSATQFLIPDHEGAGTCSQPLKEARERMTRATGLANLTIHVVDPVGLESLMTNPLGGASPDLIPLRQGSLHMPADITGGRTVINTNAPESAVPAILDESQAYYLLGFSAATPVSDRLRRVEVKVKRPGVQVRTRAGYYGNEEARAKAVTTSSVPLVDLIGGTLPRTGLPLSLIAAPFATPGKVTGTVALTLGVNSSTPREGPQRVHVAIAALNPKGIVVASLEQTVEVTARPTAAGGSSAYELLSRLELAPGRYEIRVATDTTTGERGSVFTFVDVPNFAKDSLSLTGIALLTSPSAPIAPADLFRDLMAGAPTARRAFAKTDQVKVFARVQQGSDAPVAVSVLSRIVDEMGRVVLEETRPLPAAQFAASQPADYTLDLPLSRLQTGEYLLAIQASTPATERRRNVRFTVR